MTTKAAAAGAAPEAGKGKALHTESHKVGAKPVTLIQLVIAVMTAGLANIGLMWGMIQAHETHPHSGAVTRDEVGLIREIVRTDNRHLVARIESLEELIKELKADIRSLRDDKPPK